MKKLLLTVVCFTTISFCSLAQEPVKTVDLTSVTIEQNNIKREFNSLRGEVSVLKNKNAKAESRISALESLNKDLSLKLDSLQKEYDNLANNQKADKSELSTIIGETNEKVLATEEILSSRTLWGLCGIIALIIAIVAVSFLQNKVLNEDYWKMQMEQNNYYEKLEDTVNDGFENYIMQSGMDSSVFEGIYDFRGLRESVSCRTGV